jgi:hypothetical protein
MVLDAERLPAWVTWQRRPFPDANLLLLRGRRLHAAAEHTPRGLTCTGRR